MNDFRTTIKYEDIVFIPDDALVRQWLACAAKVLARTCQRVKVEGMCHMLKDNSGGPWDVKKFGQGAAVYSAAL